MGYIMWVDHSICRQIQNLICYIILLILHLLDSNHGNTVKCQTFNLQFQQLQWCLYDGILLVARIVSVLV